MVYIIEGSDEDLEYIGLDPEMRGKRLIKLGEYWTGYWKMFYQTCEYGFYWSYEYDIHPSLLKKVN